MSQPDDLAGTSTERPQSTVQWDHLEQRTFQMDNSVADNKSTRTTHTEISLSDLDDLLEAESTPRIPTFVATLESKPNRRPSRLDRAFGWITSAMIHLIALLGVLIAYHVIADHFKPQPQPMVIPAAFFGGTVNSHYRQTNIAGSRATRLVQKQLLVKSWSAAVSPRSLSALLHDSTGHRTTLEIGLGTGGAAGAQAFSGTGSLFGKLSGHIGSGPVTSFFGVATRAQRVVYLVDTSGSMIGKLHLVKRAVRKSLHGLLPFQKFAVIVFAHKFHILGPPHLLPAQAFYRRAIDAALKNIVAEGANDNMLRPFARPFQAAFAMHPNVIYFLTDGHFDKRLIPYVARLNRQAHVQVCTFAFLDHDPVFQRRLRRIAHETGGKFEYVSRRILDNQ